MITLALIGGAPGAGKSTTARVVASRLGWPLLSKDEVKAALSHTRGTPATDSTEVFYALVGRFLAAGVSLVADHTFEAATAGRPPAGKAAPVESWASIADVRMLWCQCDASTDRLVERMRVTGSNESEIAAAQQSLEEVGPYGWQPMAGLPVLVVGTAERLEPPVDELVSYIVHT